MTLAREPRLLCSRQTERGSLKGSKQNRRGVALKVVFGGAATLVLVGCIGGYSIASAGSADSSTFGVGAVTIDLTASSSSSSTSSLASDSSSAASTESSLESAATRDIAASVEDIEVRKETERIAAEEAARKEEEAHISAAQTAIANQEASVGISAELTSVDWTVGKEAFISEWSARIDTYLAGSPLSGYGATFAEAAWEYGIDPRFSAAISNTESSKGKNCFRAYNAWGWMSSESWGSWEEAIWAHAAGLAEGYGYTISEWGAAKYCPPTWQDWYQKTLYQMTLI